MKLLQWNVRGYFSRKPALQQILDDCSPDILCLQETFLHPSKTAKLPNFHNPPHRKDRTDREGGGVSVHIRNDIPYTAINLNTELEACAVKVHLSKKTVTILSLYIPPTANNHQLEAQLDNVLKQVHPPLMICSDANAHHTSWGSQESDRRGHLIADWATDKNLVIINNTEPTYIQSNGNFSHIDLTLVTPDIAPTFSWYPMSN